MKKTGKFFPADIKIPFITLSLVLLLSHGNNLMAGNPADLIMTNRVIPPETKINVVPDTTKKNNRQHFLDGIPSTGEYMASMSMGLLAGSHDVSYFIPVSLTVSQGVLSRSGIYVGLSAGIETFQPDILPIAFDFRYYMLHRGVHPWIGAKAGYSITLNNQYYFSLNSYNYSGGPSAGAGGGVSYDINNKSSVWFYVGYRYQKLQGKSLNNGYPQENILKYNRIEFRIGISLH